MAEMCSINLWINEERYEKLNKLGLADMTKDVLAGMKVLQLQCTGEQKDRILIIYPMAKWDSATTKSIELIPAGAKDKMFNLVVEKGDLDVIEVFLKGVS